MYSLAEISHRGPGNPEDPGEYWWHAKNWNIDGNVDYIDESFENIDANDDNIDESFEIYQRQW